MTVARKSDNGGIRPLTLLLILLVAVGVGVMLLRGSNASTPEAFENAPGYQEALARSQQTGLPVLAFATADWCGPCQQLKRGALADRQVNELIRDRTVPVYLDLTSRGSPDAQAATSLGIRSIPTLVLLRDGQPVARTSGVLSKRDLLDWLRKAEAP